MLENRTFWLFAPNAQRRFLKSCQMMETKKWNSRKFHKTKEFLDRVYLENPGKPFKTRRLVLKNFQNMPDPSILELNKIKCKVM